MKFPKGGAWIMVRQTIPVEVPIDPLSCFFAKPVDYRLGTRRIYYTGTLESTEKKAEVLEEAIDDWFGSLRMWDGHAAHAKAKLVDDRAIIYCEYAEIQTRWGKVLLRPDEYSLIEPDEIDKETGLVCKEGGLADRLRHLDDGHSYLRWYNDDQQANKTRSVKFREGLFYARSRGIGLATAVQMLTGVISSTSVFYLEMHWQYQNMFIRDYPAYVCKKHKFYVEKGLPVSEILPGGDELELAQLLTQHLQDGEDNNQAPLQTTDGGSESVPTGGDGSEGVHSNID